MLKGLPTMGPASSNDTAIAVSYISDRNFGLAFYVQQSNGQRKGALDVWRRGRNWIGSLDA